jgi:hypothetical protein
MVSRFAILFGTTSPNEFRLAEFVGTIQQPLRTELYSHPGSSAGVTRKLSQIDLRQVNQGFVWVLSEQYDCIAKHLRYVAGGFSTELCGNFVAIALRMFADFYFDKFVIEQRLVNRGEQRFADAVFANMY